jgi:hypothetical protein
LLILLINQAVMPGLAGHFSLSGLLFCRFTNLTFQPTALCTANVFCVGCQRSKLYAWLFVKTRICASQVRGAGSATAVLSGQLYSQAAVGHGRLVLLLAAVVLGGLPWHRERNREIAMPLQLKGNICHAFFLFFIVTTGWAQDLRHLPLQVELWVSTAPDHGRLEACASHIAKDWSMVQDQVSLRQQSAGKSTAIQLSGLDAKAASLEVTQRCFQLRSQGQLIAQGAVLPAESARLIATPMLILSQHQPAAHLPLMVMSCGFPDQGLRPVQSCLQGWWPVASLHGEPQ